MSPVPQAGPATKFERAERLKQELVEFATNGALKDEYERQSKAFFEEATHDEIENDSVLDWFLYDWFDEDGEGAIVRYLDEHPDVGDPDCEILLKWLESINSAFEVYSTAKNSVQLKNLDDGDYYTVKTRVTQTPFRRGDFIIARLLPLGKDLIFSGLQFLMPDRESALAWLEMRQAFEAFDSPEEIEKAQREQVAAFCELFGCDELTVPSTKLNPTLQRFQRYLINERRDPETGMTPAERFRQELGQELSVPDLTPLPDPVSNASEVTILCDDFDGIVLLPDFNRFKRVFENDKPEKQVPDWKDLVWTYIKDPDIPIVAFERVAEEHPSQVEKVLRSLISDKDFSLEHLYAVLLHYKQPVDGLEDLKDDQQLWDLFNNNPTGKTQSRGRASKSQNTKTTTAKSKSKESQNTKTTTAKSKSKTTSKASARKATAKTRRSSAKRAAIGRRSSAKLTAKTKVRKGRSAPASKKRTTPRATAKKR